MTRKRLAKKKKNIVNWDLSSDNSAKDGITTPHGSTAGGRPHGGGSYTDGHIIQFKPTGHQAPDLHQALVNQSPVIQAPVIKW